MNRKLLTILVVLLVVMTSVFAEDIAFSLTTDAAYYPFAEPVPAASGDRFAPITGPYDGLEARTTFAAAYTIPVPFGDGPLVKGNTLVLKGTFELSPISIKPGFSVSLTPVAFLVFSGGAEVATGWDMAGLTGAGEYNPATHKYDSTGSFNSCWTNVWAEGLFQFDLAAIFPGDWNHIVTQDSFRIYSWQLAGQPSDQPFLWQNSKDKIPGLAYTATFVVGYQMPLVLSMVGVQSEIEGRFSDPLLPAYKAYKSDYKMYAVNPLAIFTLGEHDSLTTLLSFKTRRGYSEKCDKETQSSFDMTTTGHEWNFYRIAFSWKHTF